MTTRKVYKMSCGQLGARNVWEEINTNWAWRSDYGNPLSHSFTHSVIQKPFIEFFLLVRNCTDCGNPTSHSFIYSLFHSVSQKPFTEFFLLVGR